MSISPASDKSDRSSALVGGSIVLIAVASTAVTFRLVSRRLKRLSWEADDYLIVIALTFAYAMFIAMLFCKSNAPKASISTLSLTRSSKAFKTA